VNDYIAGDTCMLWIFRVVPRHCICKSCNIWHANGAKNSLVCENAEFHGNNVYRCCGLFSTIMELWILFI